MTPLEIETMVVQALTSVAPEVETAAVAKDVPLRDQVDLDSMDFLRFVIEIKRQSGIDVPEADYPKLATVAGAVEYLVARRPEAPELPRR
jgi:acyl carrier protein